MKMRLLWLSATMFLGLGLIQSAFVHGVLNDPPLFFTPESSAIPEVLTAIQGARTSFHMTMYHLTEPTIINALIDANNRGVDVQVILDQAEVKGEKANGAFHLLSAAHVKVVASTTALNLTHEKAFVVDGKTAFIMSINFTKITSTTRDVGLITNDPVNVQFVDDLFLLDLKNAATNSKDSPAVIPDNFVVAPANARARLDAFLNSATSSIALEVENLSDTVLINDLIQAKSRGVLVEVLLPRCDLSSADFDLPVAKQLDAAGLSVRMMPAPSTDKTPYIHQKSIVVDGQKVFLGSENFSFNSLDNSRELGIIISEPSKAAQVADIFHLDFAQGLTVAQSVAFTCPPSGFSVPVQE